MDKCFKDARVRDVAFQLFTCGMVWDGALVDKAARTTLVAKGYAVQSNGMQALTGRGAVAFWTTPVVWRFAWQRWRQGYPVFAANPQTIARAMNELSHV